jgi:hypothetical protein
MKFAEKKFSYYWDIVKVPIIILVLWSFAGLVMALFYYDEYRSTFSTAAGLIISLLCYSFVGYLCSKDCKGKVKHAAWSGAITGSVSGFIGAFVGLLSVSFVPRIIDDAVLIAVQNGAPAATARSMIEISTYLGFVTGPLFGGLIGAGVAAIAGLIACKLK